MVDRRIAPVCFVGENGVTLEMEDGRIIPELLKGFLEKVSTDGSQVVSEQIVQAEALFGFQILFALEQEPARFLQ